MINEINLYLYPPHETQNYWYTNRSIKARQKINFERTNQKSK